jgi:O-antigen/teichoic acid export membrane protein
VANIDLVQDLKRIAKHSFGFGLGTFIPVLLQFFLLPVYTRYLSPSDYGILSVAMVVNTLLNFVYLLGQEGSLVRLYYDYKENPEELRELVSTIVVLVVGVSFAVSVVLSLFGGLIFPIFVKGVDFNPYILLAIGIAFLQSPIYILRRLYQVREKSSLYSFLAISMFLVITALIIYFVVFQREGALGSLKGQFLGTLVFFAVAWFLLRKDFSFKVNLSKLKEACLFGLPLIPHDLANWALAYINRLLLAGLATVAIVGVYSVGYNLAAVMASILGTINLIWAPFLISTIKERGQEAKLIFSRLTTYYMMFILFLALALSVFARDLIMLMTTPGFLDAYKIIPIIVAAYVFTGIYYMVANQIFYTKQTKYIPVITVISAGLNILLNYLWIPRFGMLGAAWATLAAYAFQSAFTFALAHRLYPIRYEYFRIGKLFLITGAIYALSTTFSYNSILYDFLTKALLLLLYPAGLFIVSSPGERKWIYALFRRKRLSNIAADSEQRR